MNIIKRATYNSDEVDILSREYLFRGFIQVEKVSLRHRLFQQSDYTSVIHRELIQRPEAAGVLIYNDQQQKFALIEQFRIGAMDDPDSPWQLEVIAGVLDGDESPESCIRRESLEESGCELQALQHLFSFYPSAGACAELFHLYSAEATLPEQGGIFGVADEGENIQLHILDYADIRSLLTNGRLRNAPVIMALQWLEQHINTIRNV
ncbi:NUDIX hydrolase [Acinetobacter tandoii]|uniref:NUDIX domain-containing protein n=1 Tax=Acinetobacter TaxID=469 RepID=UPI000C20EDCE|nr:NUDIX domain-containing protein [Acinetobacter tandoii]PJG42651.1 NUDIX hydrolase [Acinetobacter tandoii]QDK99079.1 NUDIX domain-containing protein [Acinetobacter tandoii]